MEPPQAKPVKKRRRWLAVAIALLALMSLGTWALWPRVDPRLVGEWHAAPPENPDSYRPEFTLEIRPDGLVDHVHLPAVGGRFGRGSMIQTAGPQRFRVSGDRFEVSNDGEIGLMRLVVFVRNLVLLRRPEVITKGEIVSIEAEKLVLKFEEWGELVFVRVKDGTLEQRMRERSTGGPVLATPRAAPGAPRPRGERTTPSPAGRG